MSLEWVVRRLPYKPNFQTRRSLRRLSKRTLVDRCWVAEATQEAYEESSSEAWARCAELVDMLQGRKPVDQELLQRLEEHRAHVVSCRAGSCEHEYAALVRAGVATATVSEPEPESETFKL